MSANDYITFTTTTANSVWHGNLHQSIPLQYGWSQAGASSGIFVGTLTMTPEQEAAKLDNVMWVSHTSGRITLIVELIDEYLINAINMCQRGHDASNDAVPAWALTKLPFLISEAERRKLSGYDDGWDA
jgi:hypothetical protein